MFAMKKHFFRKSASTRALGYLKQNIGEAFDEVGNEAYKIYDQVVPQLQHFPANVEKSVRRHPVAVGTIAICLALGVAGLLTVTLRKR